LANARRYGAEGEIMTDTTNQDGTIQTRRREIAAEHVLFKLIEYVESKHPGLLDFVETSLDHLGDPATDGSKNDEAVREIARKMITGARRQGVS
jgi:hypothetical protein